MDRRFGLGGSFGVMQGRLSSQSNRGYQVFPWETWDREFELAAERGLEHIEWVLDPWRVDENPILCSTARVRQLIEDSGVRVISVCADYLMDNPLSIDDRNSWEILRKLIGTMQEVGARYLVVPCVDQASLRDLASLNRLRGAVGPLTQMLTRTGVRVALESDLGPLPFRELLDELDPDIYGVNYDIGNSASLGYSLDEEFDVYGHRISLVHVKDRLLHGRSVPLGQGDANIPKAIRLLKSQRFNGPVTMQAFRDVEGINALDLQVNWIQAELESFA